MPDSDIKKVESQIEYDHFSRMLFATIKQPEYRRIIGPLPCFIIYHCRWLIFQVWAKKTKPQIVTFEKQGEVIGGLMVGKSGEIGNPVISKEYSLQKIAIRLLSQWIDELIIDNKKRFFIRTFKNNKSIINAAKRKGFIQSNNQEYAMILKLGLLNFVWYSAHSKIFLSALLEIHPVIMLERPVS